MSTGLLIGAQMLHDFSDLHPVDDMLNVFKDLLGSVFKIGLQPEPSVIQENLFSSVDIIIEQTYCFSDFN